MQFNKQNLNTHGLKISSLNSFSVCIVYIASKSMSTIIYFMKYTLLNDFKFLLD